MSLCVHIRNLINVFRRGGGSGAACELLRTIIPKSKQLRTKKLGDTVWPEMNFVLFSYVEKEDALKVKAAVEAVKKRFPNEGISVFFTKAEEL